MLCFRWVLQWKRVLLFVSSLTYFYEGSAQNLWKRWFFLVFNDLMQNYSLQLWYVFSVSWMTLIHLFWWSRHFRYFQINSNCQYLCGIVHCFSVNFFVQTNQLEVDLFTLLLHSIQHCPENRFWCLILFSLKTLGLFHLPSPKLCHIITFFNCMFYFILFFIAAVVNCHKIGCLR